MERETNRGRHKRGREGLGLGKGGAEAVAAALAGVLVATDGEWPFCFPHRYVLRPSSQYPRGSQWPLEPAEGGGTDRAQQGVSVRLYYFWLG